MTERLRGRGGQAVVEIGGKIKQGDDVRLDGRERLMSRMLACRRSEGVRVVSSQA